MDALIRVDADCAGVRQTKRARGAHPFGYEIFRQALAQAQLDDLSEPGLQDVEDEKHASDLGEDDQLMKKGGQVASLERVVERFVPSIEDDLAEGCHNDDNDDGYAEPNDLVA
ncbi:hypothetical protein D9M72_523230 [compost metagenome]